MRPLKERIEETARLQRGVLFARPAVVYRGTYTGRGILADNASANGPGADARGYVPVEWWIMSPVEGENPVRLEGEGVTRLVLADEGECRLDDASEACEQLLFGCHRRQWPLIKLLDIGGGPVVPDFATRAEVPPIPPHVHAGRIVGGRAVGPGKLEAYFFPPTDIAPYEVDVGPVKTRLGVKPRTSKTEFVRALGDFGLSDRMYSLLNEFDVEAYDGWTIYPGIVHAPGPWVTLEVQTPQDDFNLAAWRLGRRLAGDARRREIESVMLRGLPTAEAFLEQLVDWELSTEVEFKKRFGRRAQSLEEGRWGRRLQIFFDEFYGEALELEPGQTWARAPDGRPFAGIVWSGRGTINGRPVSAESPERREFLVTPGCKLELASTNTEKLIAFTIFPIQARRSPQA